MKPRQPTEQTKKVRKLLHLLSLVSNNVKYEPTEVIKALPR